MVPLASSSNSKKPIVRTVIVPVLPVPVLVLVLVLRGGSIIHYHFTIITAITTSHVIAITTTTIII